MTFWVAGAAVVAAGVGAVSANNASKRQQAATNQAIQAQQDQANLTRNDTEQGRHAGTWALQQLLGGGSAYTPSASRANFDDAAYLKANPDVARDTRWGQDPWGHFLAYGQREGRAFTYTPEAQAAMAGGSGPGELNKPVTAADVMQDPGYQFGLQQGQQALDRKAAAAGGRVSGAALKSAAQYATNYATAGYGAAYQRGQDRLNRLQQLAGMGQVATNASANAGAVSTNAISNLLSSQGNASGAAGLAQGNIWGNAANQLGAVGQRWATSPSARPQNVPAYQQSFTTLSD